MTILTLLFGLLVSQGHALPWDQLQIGATVELTQNLSPNKLLSGSGLQCMRNGHAVYPRVIVGPNAPDVQVKYFTIVLRSTDVATYRLYLQSEQMPCGCELNIDQAPEFFGGLGSEFRMLVPIQDRVEFLRTPAIASSCSLEPNWVAPPKNPRPTRSFM